MSLYQYIERKVLFLSLGPAVLLVLTLTGCPGNGKGEGNGNGNEETLTYTLTVTKTGTGSGTVTSSLAGINCGTDCSEVYNNGTAVILTAAPASDSNFTGWSGACTGTGTCAVTMDATKSVSATFTLKSDPLFGDQWHLQNTGQAGGTAGEDVNVVPVWSNGYKGDGILIAIVDDGLEIAHEDLAANIVPGLSYNYVDLSTDPTGTGPGASEHGTAVAGVAAARDLNDLGVRGAAPRASLVGYNLLQNSIDTNQADAMIRNLTSVDISSNSLGPPDGTGLLNSSNSLWSDAINTGLNSGGSGLGTIYTWAAGNGAPTDNSNYDGYANHRGVMAICAIGDDGVKASDSERGANLWVCAPSLGRANHGITTTDRTGSLGYNLGVAPDYVDPNYTNTFNGTSSATPLASGVIALILQANPSLGWRDVRLILAQTARMNDPANTDWTTNAAGYNINHNYGFGVIDAQAAVNAALTWTNVGAEVTYSTALSSPGLAIPDNNATGVSDTITVSGSGISNLEFIEITFSASDHTYFGALEITLTNETTGTNSILAENHVCLDANSNQITCTPSYNAWIFGSVRHLGEGANGNWTLKVADLDAFGDTGTFQSWQLKFYGR